MKKLLIAMCAATALCAYAEDKKEEVKAEVEKEADGAPLFWGFGATGIYSGYQLYGSLVNSEPTWQTYLEGNMNLIFGDLDLGYLGAGLWFNTDLTDKRRDSYEQFLNEQDWNIHWGRTFWFDDNNTWGLAYRTSIVWYYYPHHGNTHAQGKTNTTMDWNHYVELVNPYVIPYANFVHEYHESDGNLIQFGLKKTVAVNDAFSLTPGIEFVWRNSNYCWCFPHFGCDETWSKVGSGLATMKIGLDANYQLTDHFGVFAKIAYCQTLDADLRDAAEAASGADYGKYKDFAWGGVGLSFNF